MSITPARVSMSLLVWWHGDGSVGGLASRHQGSAGPDAPDQALGADDPMFRSWLVPVGEISVSDEAVNELARDPEQCRGVGW